MRTALALIVLLAFGVAVAALDQPQAGGGHGDPPVVTLPTDLERVLRDYERAWRAGDGAGLAALFTVDGFAVQSGRPWARGRSAIATQVDGPGGTLQLHAYAFHTSGTAGHIVGGYRYPGSEGPAGRFVLALRHEGGRWLIAADLDNNGPLPAPPPADDVAVLTRLNADYVQAVLSSDARRFEQLLATDFRNTNSDGTILDRDGFLAQVARPSNLRSLRAEGVEIRVFGGTAIVHAGTAYETSDGRPGRGRYTDIWRKQNGEWRAVAAHVTRLVQ